MHKQRKIIIKIFKRVYIYISGTLLLFFLLYMLTIQHTGEFLFISFSSFFLPFRTYTSPCARHNKNEISFFSPYKTLNSKLSRILRQLMTVCCTLTQKELQPIKADEHVDIIKQFVVSMLFYAPQKGWSKAFYVSFRKLQLRSKKHGCYMKRVKKKQNTGAGGNEKNKRVQLCLFSDKNADKTIALDGLASRLW